MEVVDPPLEQKLKEYVRGSSEEGSILERLEQAFFVHGATYVAPDAAPDVASDATPDVASDATPDVASDATPDVE